MTTTVWAQPSNWIAAAMITLVGTFLLVVGLTQRDILFAAAGAVAVLLGALQLPCHVVFTADEVVIRQLFVTVRVAVADVTGWDVARVWRGPLQPRARVLRIHRSRGRPISVAASRAIVPNSPREKRLLAELERVVGRDLDRTSG